MTNLFEKAQKLRNNGKIDEAIELYKKVGDTESLHMIGVAYYQIKKFKEANKYLQKSLNEFRQEGNEEFQGFVLRDLGAVARAEKNLTEAERFLKESIDLLQKTGNKGHEGMSRVKLGRVFADQEKFDEAFDEINRGIELLNESTDQFFLSTAYLDRAKVDIQKSFFILNSISSQEEFTERRKEIKRILENL